MGHTKIKEIKIPKNAEEAEILRRQGQEAIHTGVVGIENVPLGEIRIDSRYTTRLNNPEKDLECLVVSIKRDGLLQPIVIKPVGYKRYVVVVGQRRFRAVEKLGWPTIPATIRVGSGWKGCTENRKGK